MPKSDGTSASSFGTLFVVGTPVGNLEDITFRAVRVLQQVDVIAAEDTRITGRLLARYDIATPMVSYREQNADNRVPMIVDRLTRGSNVALVSDAGTPSISDPGQQLVAAAYAAGVAVSPVPGASALASAVSVAALPGDGVRFVGFLPRKGRNRDERLSTIAVDPSCSVIYESPHRLPATLKDLARYCGNRRAVVAREMTKLHEEVIREPLDRLIERFETPPKGEVTLVIEGNSQLERETVSDAQLSELVRDGVEQGHSARDISQSLSAALGVKKKEIYRLAVKLLQNR